MNIEEYNCRECGACCMYKFMVEVDYKSELPESVLYPNEIRGGRVLNKKPNGDCICFDSKDCKCTIYEQRPRVCRGVVPGDQWCEQARSEVDKRRLKYLRRENRQTLEEKYQWLKSIAENMATELIDKYSELEIVKLVNSELHMKIKSLKSGVKE